MNNFLTYFICPFIISLIFYLVYLFRKKFPLNFGENFDIRLNNPYFTIILPLILVILLQISFMVAFHTPLVDTIERNTLMITRAVVFTPIAEEFFIRGVLLGCLFIWVPKVVRPNLDRNFFIIIALIGLILTSFLFALWHENPNIGSFLLRLTAGLVYGGLYLLNKRNLLPAMIGHSFNNLLIFIIQ